MQRAGYLTRDGKKVLDSDGVPCEILELHIFGARLCMLIDEVKGAIQRGTPAAVVRIKQNWMEYLGGKAGNAQVSRSGKALNIELVNGDRFTLSLDCLSEVLNYRERCARIMELSPQLPQETPRNRLITDFSMPLQSYYSPDTADQMTA